MILSKAEFTPQQEKEMKSYSLKNIFQLILVSWIMQYRALRLLSSNQRTQEVREPAPTSPVRKQDTWTQKCPSFGSVCRQINTYFYRSDHRSSETLSLFFKQGTVLNSIINIQVQNSLMDSVGEGEGGKIWENGIETCKISCMK